jgi:hypothetical protein
MAITKGDLVVFRKGLYKDEEGAIYRVIETNGDRGILELVNTNMVIRPQTVSVLAELDLLDQDTSSHKASFFLSE